MNKLTQNIFVYLRNPHILKYRVQNADCNFIYEIAYIAFIEIKHRISKR